MMLEPNCSSEGKSWSFREEAATSEDPPRTEENGAIPFQPASSASLWKTETTGDRNTHPLQAILEQKRKKKRK